MAAMLHDPAVRGAIEARVRALTPDARPRWGKMSVDQMLWHCCGGLQMAMGEVTLAPQRAPLPRSVLRFAVLNLPWPKGAPTLPPFVAKDHFDLNAERDRCLALIDRFTARPLDGSWPAHPMLGPVSGRDVSRLHAKHLDHHLKQFGR